VPDSLISHLGIAVKDLESSIQLWSILLGHSPIIVTEVPDQKVRVAIFPSATKAAGGRIELVGPTSPDSPISRFLSSHGEGLHHVCVFVDDLESRLRELKSAGVRLIDETPRIGAEGHRIAFVHPIGANGVLLELEERTQKD
jgi:methylmalonyl-CoA/ethylmalonyl-CoA epimerase